MDEGHNRNLILTFFNHHFLFRLRKTSCTEYDEFKNMLLLELRRKFCKIESP